jgi:hypothetical protein
VRIRSNPFLTMAIVAPNMTAVPCVPGFPSQTHAFPKDKTSSFREPLKKPADLTKAEVRVRAAEVYREPIIPPDSAGFRVGVEDTSGTVAWVDVNSVGGLPRPFGRRTFDFAHGRADKTKTMLSTFRFPGSCFGACSPESKA